MLKIGLKTVFLGNFSTSDFSPYGQSGPFFAGKKNIQTFEACITKSSSNEDMILMVILTIIMIKITKICIHHY